MKLHLLGILPLALGMPLVAQHAPRVSTSLPAVELEELKRLRHDVWANWFSGDTVALRNILGPELVAMSPDSPSWQSLDETIAGSARFKAGGGRFVNAAFDPEAIHRFGDVVVMFSRYAVTTEAGGQQQTQKGRATEVFVRHRGKWVHTSWQLDIDR